MTSSSIVLRGPALCCVHNDNSFTKSRNIFYEEDALIFIENEKIIDFGPANKLYRKLKKDIQVKKYKKCRIINTFIQS